MDFLVTIFTLGFVVFIHECGHFLFARIAGVKVHEFSVGLGPQLFSFSRKDTLYSIRALPLGGFVKLAGMDQEEGQSVSDHESYKHKPFLSKLSIILAGPFMNILLSYLIFVGIFLFVGKGVLQPVIDDVVSDSPAYVAGIEPGDRLLSLNGNDISDVKSDVIDVISSTQKGPIIFKIQRDELVLEKEIEPQLIQNQEKPKIGIILAQDMIPISIFEALSIAKTYLISSISVVFKSIGMLFSSEFSLDHLSGPIGIIQVASHVFDTGWIPFFNLVGFISLMLGILNLLPFPIFDGGHVFFLILEKLRGKPLSKKVEIVVMNLSVAFLLTVMFVVIINDIILWKDRVEQIKGFIND